MTATPITSGQEDQINRLLDDTVKKALKRLKPTKDDAERLLARGKELQEATIADFRRLMAPAPDYALAKNILGGDFITPEEVIAVRPVKYTDEQIMALAAQLPSEEALRWCKENGYALIASPPSPLSILDVRSLQPDHFYSKTGGWYSEEREKFAKQDMVGFGWLMIRKQPVHGSTRKNWNEQNQLLSEYERVPNAAEMAWFITTFFEIRGVRLFESIYVRTSSRDSDGFRVYVGYFDAVGLHVGYDWDGDRDDVLGLAAARK